MKPPPADDPDPDPQRDTSRCAAADHVVGAFGEARVLAMLQACLPGFAVESERPGGAAPLGIGDDCAVLPPVPDHERAIVTTDALVVGTHFDGRWADPDSVGHKAFAVNASDVASMGGRPTWALLALTLPPALPWAWLCAFAEGFAAAARAHGVAVVGGNLARGPAFSATITLFGVADAAHVVTRGGARPDDRVFVTGALGAARAGLRTLTNVFAAEGPALAEVVAEPSRWSAVRDLASTDEAVRAQLRPDARVRWGRCIAPFATAMIDLSDGLMRDAARVAERSSVCLALDASRVSCGPGATREDALVGGEDYELLFTVSPAALASFAACVRAEGLVVTELGVVREGHGVVWSGAGAPETAAGLRGFEHFDTNRAGETADAGAAGDARGPSEGAR